MLKVQFKRKYLQMAYIFKTLSIHRVSLHRLDDFLYKRFKGTFSYCSADSDRVLRYIYCNTSQLERSVGVRENKNALINLYIFYYKSINKCSLMNSSTTFLL